MSIAKACYIVAADEAAKTAIVELIELRIARGMCGKSYLMLTGEIAAVEGLSCKITGGRIMLALERRNQILEKLQADKKVVVSELSQTYEVSLAADHTKFDHTAFAQIARLEDIDIVVTDEKPDIKWLQALEDMSVKCVYPD